MRLFMTLCLLLSSFIASTSELMSAIKPVKQAAVLRLPDTKGEVISLANYKGKYVLVNFWAYWCGPCIKEFPAMENLYQALKPQGLEILAVHVGPFESAGADFLKSTTTSFKVLIDKNTELKKWKVPALPWSYLIDPQGKLVYQAIGSKTWDIETMKKLMRN
ncbi:TlpA disulfide reductase family protein [Pseudoalteromonas denitrificans]|uniref:Peroxiredoxin n=1 Tax=Pseudoalteromonas denitrificans DSM 6059 TaxID=1123010 RepID=A0A1I1IFU0_9GAMM|nr:TlpA disulfide reductase family protein [Pseudoalteromonas denitrificans]SFC33088.1 Peroxiredoxin [Pseudoalteromonas denitrificans DSM 6059]